MRRHDVDSWNAHRTPESTDKCLSQKVLIFGIFTPSLLTKISDFYPYFALGISGRRFLSLFKLRPQIFPRYFQRSIFALRRLEAYNFGVDLL